MLPAFRWFCGIIRLSASPSAGLGFCYLSLHLFFNFPSTVAIVFPTVLPILDGLHLKNLLSVLLLGFWKGIKVDMNPPSFLRSCLAISEKSKMIFCLWPVPTTCHSMKGLYCYFMLRPNVSYIVRI